MMCERWLLPRKYFFASRRRSYHSVVLAACCRSTATAGGVKRRRRSIVSYADSTMTELSWNVIPPSRISQWDVNGQVPSAIRIANTKHTVFVLLFHTRHIRVSTRVKQNDDYWQHVPDVWSRNRRISHWAAVDRFSHTWRWSRHVEQVDVKNGLLSSQVRTFISLITKRSTVLVSSLLHLSMYLLVIRCVYFCFFFLRGHRRVAVGSMKCIRKSTLDKHWHGDLQLRWYSMEQWWTVSRWK